jgi:UDP:flavonoid glycosyltransferase YjiC (YdhE family)
MRLLIPVFSPVMGTWGGLTRVLAVAEAALAAGHEVAFCASGYLESHLRQRGYQVFATPPTTMFGLPPAPSGMLERRSRSLSLPARSGRDVGNFWMVFLAFGMARGRYLRQLVEAERHAAEVFRAEALFTDYDPGAYLLARVTGLPIATTYQGVMAQGIGSPQWRLMNRAVASALCAHGQPPCPVEQLFFGPTVLKIIPSIPELDGTDPSRDDVFYAGQLLGELHPTNTAPSLVPDPDRRYIWAYMGSGAVPAGRVRRILAELCAAQPDLSCVVSAQGIGHPQQVGQVHVLPYVDLQTLLPHTEWTICHGGQNTIIESLLYGVPLLVFPGPIFERRFNARKVAQAGAGFMGERNDFTVGWLTTSMKGQHQAKAASERLGDRIRSYKGATGAVETMTTAWSL